MGGQRQHDITSIVPVAISLWGARWMTTNIRIAWCCGLLNQPQPLVESGLLGALNKIDIYVFHDVINPVSFH